MTPEEFKNKAQEIYDRHDGCAMERGHIEIDDLMIECLEMLGYKEGCDILFSMDDIWYC